MPKETTKKTARKTTRASAAKKTAAKKTAVKKTAVKKTPVKKTVARKTAAKKTTARKTAAKKSPARKKAVKEPIITTVIAKFDAGFGNQLYIRGNSSGLTWDAGELMENASPDEWTWTSTAVTSELEFKVLLNDKVWSIGANGVLFPGATVVFEPVF